MLRVLRWVVALGAGCSPDPEGTPETDPEGLVRVRDGAPCLAPTVTFGDLRDEGPARGLSADNPNGPDERTIPGSLAEDLDGDGDIDIALLFSSTNEHIRLLWNDGTGHFRSGGEPSWDALLLEPPISRALAAADLDGDRLPELLLLQPGRLLASTQERPGDFGPFVPIYSEDTDPPAAWTSLAVGDPDGDADLDILITTTFANAFVPSLPHGTDVGVLSPAAADPLLGNEDGTFIKIDALEPYGRPNYAQIATFTDRDRDGDVDLLLPSEFGGMEGADPTAFFRNDGPGPDGRTLWINDAPELGFAFDVGGMGLDSTDLNGDGRLDYCVVQVGPTRCAISNGEVYLEGGASTGLGPSPRPDWSGYSFEFADLDNDGEPDAAAAGGATGDGSDPNPDRLWQGIPGGTFDERSAERGFDDPDDHLGLSAADFDGDGAIDLLLSALDEPPPLWMNRCGVEHWIELDLDGPGRNRQGFGAQIEVVAGGRSWLREIHSLRAVGQGPARIHVGLGPEPTVDRILVRWPGGEETVVEGPIATNTVWRVPIDPG